MVVADLKAHAKRLKVIGLTVQEYGAEIDQRIADVDAALESYYQQRAKLDAQLNEIEAKEDKLAERESRLANAGRDPLYSDLVEYNKHRRANRSGTSRMDTPTVARSGTATVPSFHSFQAYGSRSKSYPSSATEAYLKIERFALSRHRHNGAGSCVWSFAYYIQHPYRFLSQC
jgi:hypothetical protein